MIRKTDLEIKVKDMLTTNTTIIRANEKKKAVSQNSEYIFHYSFSSGGRGIGLYEGYFKNAGGPVSLHYHKHMTEVFTVLKGEFQFRIGDSESVYRQNDTVIIPPMVHHGFSPLSAGSRLQFLFLDVTDREGFFLELAQITNGELILTEDEKELFFNRYDQYSVK